MSPNDILRFLCVRGNFQKKLFILFLELLRLYFPRVCVQLLLSCVLIVKLLRKRNLNCQHIVRKWCDLNLVFNFSINCVVMRCIVSVILYFTLFRVSAFRVSVFTVSYHRIPRDFYGYELHSLSSKIYQRTVKIDFKCLPAHSCF